ncbi:hypothetical protein [Streptomyces sp. AS02]|uniref:hypothetical protein n=1 Tax=Streptomyces sp. AS02 TaxID=2938946 RepID=UPI0020225F96|nr:hypothetical protein [Streptomyces sp. AS02]MCL8012056.1 hypothetical protein [Streptomyces sp. AS02]
MTVFLALVAVVGYMATAHLPWWVVVVVALLMAGFAAGRSWSPVRGARTTTTQGPTDRPSCPPADMYPPAPPAPPVSVSVGATCPDDQ